MHDTLSSVRIAPLTEADRTWANELLITEWGSTLMITRGQAHDCSALPGFVGWYASQRAGLLTYRIDGDECEIMSLNSYVERSGIGSALLAAVEAEARAAGCATLYLITSNDNLHALGFYQRRGYRLAALYPGAIDAARALKPEIPLTGFDNIPLHDEIELSKRLTSPES